MPELDNNINASLDPTNVTDANVFEELGHNNTLSLAVIGGDKANQHELPNVPQAAEEPTNQNEAGNLETISTVVIVQFPNHSTGTTVPGIAHVESS